MKPNIKSAKVIPNKILKTAWKKISDRPLPELYAYALKDSAFLSTLKMLQQNKSVTDSRSEEYNVNFDNKSIEALTFEFEGHMIVFVRDSVPLLDALEHELKHVSEWKHEDKHSRI